ncbi:MAG TPA: glycosyltransferase family 4 protein [Verrucomicrobiae bacterium]|nr:glycosyltransferase family 4 protein [Verrucomicrobiae bacterium]
MRVLKILQTSFHTEWNGQIGRIFLLSRELARRGHRVLIAAPAGSALARRAAADGLSVFTGVRFRKTNRPVSFCRDALALARLARAERFDAIHTHGSQDTWAAIAAVRIARLETPVLMTRHNTKPVRFNRANRWLYGRGIDRLVVVSRAGLENYRPFFRAGILDESQVTVIHSAIDLDRFQTRASPEKIRSELGLGGAAPLIGLIGRVSKDKGHEILLEAAPRVLEEFPDAVFVFAGKVGRSLGPKLRLLIDQKGLSHAVRFFGFRDDIVSITAALDVSVLPAVGTESSPAVLKEAFLLGKPVVASRLAGLPEIVPEGAGLLVEPGNARELAEAIIATLRRRGNGVAVKIDLPQQFTPNFMCEAYLAVYERLLDPHSTKGAA